MVKSRAEKSQMDTLFSVAKCTECLYSNADRELRHATVAQMVEQTIRNRQVSSSILLGGFFSWNRRGAFG
jgi:hypothetical protein